MGNNSLIALAFLAIIIGAGGLGLGAYSTMQVQTGALKGDEGDDGDDGDAGKDGTDWQTPSTIYYCSSQSEIEDALDTIGFGHGTIIITQDITLTRQINIDDGGDYIIQGAGRVKIDRNSNDETFYITNVETLILKDIFIDTSDITSDSIPGVYVNEGKDNPVYIQNVQIGGGDMGQGIYVNSENVWIEDCIFEDLHYSINLDSSSAYCHILDNSILDGDPGGTSAYGIRVYNSAFNTISGNVVHDLSSNADNARGIDLYLSDFNTISGNIVYGLSSNIGDAIGIRLSESYNNTISGNVVHDLSSINFNAIGIYIYVSEGNVVVGNRIHQLFASGGSARGVGIYSSNLNTISANIISNFQGFSIDGISGGGGSANNVIVGNILNNCGTITISAINNVIEHNVEVP